MSFVEAARAVGISTRTGERWRNGRGASGRFKAAPPVNAAPVAEPTDSMRYLHEADRVHIADRLRERAGIRAIAAELGRSPSTISREVRRNGTALADGRWHYRPYSAQRRADARRPRPKTGKIGRNPELHDFIQSHLALRWSPEQICHALRRHFLHRPEMHVSHETIYQALYSRGRTDLRRELTGALRTGRARRRPRRLADRRRSRAVKNMVMISQRPAEAADRAVAGHWEGDLILGRQKHSAIATLVERSTRYLLLVHLPDGYNSAAVRDALITTVNALPPQLKRSLTWDQGTEMAAHHGFSIATNVPVYFCNPGSPWQRGSNENTNGLLRQYFPKGTDLSTHTPEDLQAVAAELNSRPRKTLGWETPAERLHKLLAA
ncbi:IS30 family transposase [Streptomyces echinatus]|uniref:IS30 family transposase n=1 Tax=Streptomyces echinatus TaxID=67293 RepID=A0A7W9PQA7_9ACTN|nr:IS30 family transposase [Streptomyces echinatus]MBB5925851.1 IS30 family transposase [Streptomyces echinatus]